MLRTAGASEGLANALIERLVDAHLVRADHRGGAIWYELAHDRLVGPVRVDNERWAQANLQPVQVQAALWARQDRPATLLLSEEALTEVERWVASQPGPLGEPDQSFLAASRAARAQERAVREAQAQALSSAQDLAQAQARAAARQRTFTRLATVLALAAVLAAAVSYSQYKEAGEQTKRAEEASARFSEAKERAEEAAIRALDQSRIAASGATTDPTIQAVLLRELAAAMAWRTRARPDGAALLAAAVEHTTDGPTREGLVRAARFRSEGMSLRSAARLLGSGYGVISSDTVPFALLCASLHLGDYAAAMWATVAGLGDRDTTCAIAGGVVALTGAPIPAAWLAAREPLSY